MKPQSFTIINNMHLKMDIGNFHFIAIDFCIKSRDLLSYHIQNTVILQLSILIDVSKQKPC